MRGKGKNKRSALSDFLRYSGKKMTNPERNAFEREFQKDPFSEEASEGFASIDTKAVEEDVFILKKRLKSRTKRKQRIIYYRIAASVAVLMVISSIFILIERNRSSMEINKIKNDKVALAIPEPSPVIKSAGNQEVKEKRSAPEGKKENKSAPVAPVRETEKKEIQTVSTKPAAGQAKENNRALDISEAERIVAADQVAVSKSITAGRPGNSVEFEKKVSQTGYRIEKKVSQSGYNPPEPIQGRKGFESYIEENLRIPDELKKGEKDSVVMSFIVRSNGIIDSIKIIRSPGRSFSDEAIRLIREGPLWKPANEKGLPVDEEVRIRIVFK